MIPSTVKLQAPMVHFLCQIRVVHGSPNSRYFPSFPELTRTVPLLSTKQAQVWPACRRCSWPWIACGLHQEARTYRHTELSNPKVLSPSWKVVSHTMHGVHLPLQRAPIEILFEPLDSMNPQHKTSSHTMVGNISFDPTSQYVHTESLIDFFNQTCSGADDFITPRAVVCTWLSRLVEETCCTKLFLRPSAPCSTHVVVRPKGSRY